MAIRSRILGIGCHLPQRAETNEDLLRENPDWGIEKIFDKTGIWARRIAADGETAGDLATEACRKLLKRNLVPADQIDYLLYCSQSPEHYLPSTACVLQERLELGRHIGALDFNLGCSGYIYGLQLAKSLIETAAARNVLLVTADTYSKYIHPNDRIVRTLFGDGAAATLLGPANEEPGRIGEFVLGTDGKGAESLIVPSGALRLPRSEKTSEERTDLAGCIRSQDNLFMDGQAIFSFALNTVPELIDDLMSKSGTSADEIDWYVYHQANKFMLENLALCSEIPAEKMVYYLKDVGNTVSSSIPLSIQKYVESGKIQPGHKLMLIGFGVGFSWGGCVMTWG